MLRSSRLTACLAAVSVALLSLGAGRSVAEEATSVDVLGKAKMSVPSEFKKSEKKSRIIEHEFKVGEDEKAARLTMMRAGGGVQPNIKRWKGQFSGGKEEDQKTETFKAGPFEVHLIDVAGTFAESMGGGPFFGGKTVQRENYAMVGAIFESEDRLYFAKMVGPAETIKANREKFVEMAKSVGK
ncbi:hypothetical protein [Roseiconus lacunae]|uniref:Uncharacterized protein n=1 Tax=Roseiconus lacunae TaxID=2605694 RepID=A0ABT7PD16_9BACT|nr:hypothetical protein [Roseiconus lacunae]MDM4014111.1 hypothetical protein [Roseiconus lacunae]